MTPESSLIQMSVWNLGSHSLDQPPPTCLFSLLAPYMWGSGLYEWMRKFITEGVVNDPNFGVNFVTYFARPHLASCHSMRSSWRVCQLSDGTKCVQVGYWLRRLKEVYAGRCLRLSGQLIGHGHHTGNHEKSSVAYVHIKIITLHIFV